MSNLYGMVSNTTDMKILHLEALQDNHQAVGFSKSGQAYIYDDEEKKAIKIPPEQACDILNIDMSTLKKIIDSKCKYQVPIPAIEEDEVDEEEDEEAQENEEDNDIEEDDEIDKLDEIISNQHDFYSLVNSGVSILRLIYEEIKKDSLD